jgi:hypothetical protein
MIMVPSTDDWRAELKKGGGLEQASDYQQGGSELHDITRTQLVSERSDWMLSGTLGVDTGARSKQRPEKPAPQQMRGVHRYYGGGIPSTPLLRQALTGKMLGTPVGAITGALR